MVCGYFFSECLTTCNHSVHRWLVNRACLWIQLGVHCLYFCRQLYHIWRKEWGAFFGTYHWVKNFATFDVRHQILFLTICWCCLFHSHRRRISQASQQTFALQFSEMDSGSTELSNIELAPVQLSVRLRQQLQRVRMQVFQHWPVVHSSKHFWDHAWNFRVIVSWVFVVCHWQVLPSIKEALVLISRANLMLFYFKGSFLFNWRPIWSLC